jgi:hypothetical protein
MSATISAPLSSPLTRPSTGGLQKISEAFLLRADEVIE